MADSVRKGTPLERRFHGSVVLMLLHLRRIAHSNDLEAGLSAARELYAFPAEDEALVRACLVLDERFQSGEGIEADIDEGTIARLQACARKVNSADPA